MHIDHSILAKLIGTNPSNIRKTDQTEEKILVQLWNSKEQVVVDIQQYKAYLENHKKNHKFSASDARQSIGLVLMIIAAFLGINAYAMNTTVDGSKTLSDPNLVDRQNKQLQLGGIFLIVGTIFYCSDKKEKGND
jgi:hypothetical protein